MRGLPLRLAGAGVQITGILVVLFVSVLFTTFLNVRYQTGILSPILLLWVIPTAVGIVVGLGIGRFGRRMALERGRDVMELDSRPPVLFLRSFAEDGVNEAPRSSWVIPGLGLTGRLMAEAIAAIGTRTEEERIEVLFAGLGPVIAAGFPGERVRHAGAARLELGQDHWMEAIEDLIVRSRLVIVRVGESPGLEWEVQTVVARVEPSQCLLYLTYREDRDELWARFCESVEAHFPGGLPNDVGRAVFLTFSKNWEPRLIGEGGALDQVDVSTVAGMGNPTGRAVSRRWIGWLAYGIGLAGIIPFTSVAALDHLLPGIDPVVGFVVFVGTVFLIIVASSVLVNACRRSGMWHTARFGLRSVVLFLFLPILFVTESLLGFLDKASYDVVSAAAYGAMGILYFVVQPISAWVGVKRDWS